MYLFRRQEAARHSSNLKTVFSFASALAFRYLCQIVFQTQKQLMNFKKTNLFIAAFCLCSAAQAEQADSTLTYRIEASGNVSEGTYAPLWVTANRYGLSSQEL